MSEDDPICVLAHKSEPDRPRRAWTGYLCRGHSEGLWRVLSELADFAGQADEASYDEMAGEVFELGQRAFSLLNPSGVRRIDVGPCRELVEGEDGKLTVCGGQITALVRKSDDLLPSSIRCNACGVEVTADRWLTYGRALRSSEAA
jgi:hypothetical protein